MMQVLAEAAQVTGVAARREPRGRSSYRSVLAKR